MRARHIHRSISRSPATVKLETALENTGKRVGELLANPSFQRWLDGACSPTEKLHWENWLHSDSKNSELVENARELRDQTAFTAPDMPAPDLFVSIQDLEARIAEAEKRDSDPQVIPPASNAKASSNQFRYIAVAAALLLATTFIFYSWVSNSAGEEYHTAFGERQTVDLPDGSIAILNGNSSLLVDAGFGKKGGRNVTMTGEIYFDVRKSDAGADPHFRVHTKDGVIQVLGTRFNVLRTKEKTRVVLEEGRVKVHVLQDEIATNNPSSSIVLQPGQAITFRHHQILPDVEIGSYSHMLSWWKEFIVFDETPVSAIVKRLEWTYGVTVRVDDPSIFEQTISGRIPNNDLPSIVNTLARVLQVNASIDGNSIVLVK